MASERIKRSAPRRRPSHSALPATNVLARPLRIGEAAKLVGVEAYVLRFWETQFSFIRPKQLHSRHRYYTGADIETLKIVKRLLHTEGYTIAGARRFVREKGLDQIRGPRPAAAAVRQAKLSAAASATPLSEASAIARSNGVHRALREIREDLRALHKLLDRR